MGNIWMFETKSVCHMCGRNITLFFCSQNFLGQLLKRRCRILMKKELKNLGFGRAFLPKNCCTTMLSTGHPVFTNLTFGMPFTWGWVSIGVGLAWCLYKRKFPDTMSMKDLHSSTVPSVNFANVLSLQSLFQSWISIVADKVAKQSPLVLGAKPPSRQTSAYFLLIFWKTIQSYSVGMRGSNTLKLVYNFYCLFFMGDEFQSDVCQLCLVDVLVKLFFADMALFKSRNMEPTRWILSWVLFTGRTSGWRGLRPFQLQVPFNNGYGHIICWHGSLMILVKINLLVCRNCMQ